MDEQRVNFAANNVIACYPDMEAARAGVEALEHAGVSASDISLLGPGAEEAAATVDTAQRDAAIMEKGTKATAGGALAGTGVGGVVGFLAGTVAFGIPGVGPVVGAGLWASTIGAAAAGGGVGFTAGAMAGVKQSQAWELTLQDVDNGKTVVGAHLDDTDGFERAVEALEGTAPEKIRRYDGQGEPIAD